MTSFFMASTQRGHNPIVEFHWENCDRHERNGNKSAWFSLVLAADRDGGRLVTVATALVLLMPISD
jgi:hypothetical protein